MKDRIGYGLYVGLLMAVLLGLFGLVWVYTATQRVRFLPEESAAWRAHIQMIDHCDTGRITILGSSRASAAFVPKVLGPDVTNLAMSGGTPVEAYYEARKIYRCASPPTIIILSFSPIDWEISDWFWSRSARFGLLTDDDLNDIANNAAAAKDTVLYHSYFGSEPPPGIKNFLYSTYFPPYDFASLIAARSGRKRRSGNIRLTRETLENRGQHLMYQNVSICDTEVNALKAAPHVFRARTLTTIYFKKLVQLLSSRDVTILYISSPENQLGARDEGESYVRAYENFISDLRHDESFSIIGPLTPIQSLCDFADKVHVNQAGAETFSRHVKPVIAAALRDERTPTSLERP